LWLWITLGALGFVVIVGLGVYFYKKRQDSLGDSKVIVYGANQDAAEQKLINKYSSSAEV
jgi:LPXTG-motif cell wall-anchored protein